MMAYLFISLMSWEDLKQSPELQLFNFQTMLSPTVHASTPHLGTNWQNWKNGKSWHGKGWHKSWWQQEPAGWWGWARIEAADGGASFGNAGWCHCQKFWRLSHMRWVQEGSTVNGHRNQKCGRVSHSWPILIQIWSQSLVRNIKNRLMKPQNFSLD